MDSEGFDFGPYDSDGDKKIDHVVVLHSGFTAETGEIPCHTGVSPSFSILFLSADDKL